MEPVKELDRSVRGCAVLVTGAARGMGRATAHLFADEVVHGFCFPRISPRFLTRP